MKLKSAIFILFLILLILFSTNIYAFGTDIYEIAENANGIENWRKNIYAFCLDAAYKTPSQFNKRKLFTINNFNITENKISEFNSINSKSKDFNLPEGMEKIIKTAYIYSTIDYEERKINIYTPQQYVLWELFENQTREYTIKEGTGNSENGNNPYYYEWIDSPISILKTIDKQKEFQDKMDVILANSNAYWEYYRNPANFTEDRIDVSEVKLEENLLGPFHVYYKSSGYVATSLPKYYLFERIGDYIYESNKYIKEESSITCQYPNILEVTLKKTGDTTGLTMKGGTVSSENSYTCNEEFNHNRSTGQMKYTFYLNVPKILSEKYISDITPYNTIEIKLNGEITGDLLIGESNKLTEGKYQQSSIVGDIKKTEKTISASFAGINFKLLKVDSETGAELPNAIFGYAAYTRDAETSALKLIDNATYTVNNSESLIDNNLGIGSGWRKVVPNDNINVGNIGNYEEVYIVLQETSAPIGYKKLDDKIAIKFQKENGKWICKEVGEADWGNDGFTFKTKTENNLASFDNDALELTIKNEPSNFYFYLKKIDSETGEILSGAEFSILAFNNMDFLSNSDKKIDIVTTAGNENINITIDDESLDKIWVVIKETKAPDGYKILEEPKILTFTKQEDGSWRSDDLETDNVLTIENEPDESDESDELGSEQGSDSESTDPSKDIIKGYVYLDGYSGKKKAEAPDGNKGDDDGIKGVIVRLSDGRWTTTKDDGSYEFNNITRGQTYTITFEYDGVNYEATTAGAGSQATETTRATFNNKFKTIKYGQTESGIGLTYWPYDSRPNRNSTYNPSYYYDDSNYRPGWLLKTLDKNQIVNNDNFKMTASTIFQLINDEQYHYDVTSYTADCDEGDEETPPSHNHSSNNLGKSWFDSPKSDTWSGWCDSGKTYDHLGTNYYIKGGTTQTRNNKNLWYYYENTYKSEADRDAAVTYNLNFGLVKREVDLSLVNDLFRADVSINGKSTQYDYADVPLRNTENAPLNVAGTNMSDEGYDYLLELTRNDFLYGTSIYPEGNSYVKNAYDDYIKNSEYTEDRPLTIIATYRVALNNQSTTGAKVNSLAYYYDINYMEPTNVYIGDYNGYSIGTCTKTNNGTQVIDGVTYNRIDITGIPKVTGGGQQYVYIVFEMNNDNTIERKTYNTIAEITSYSADDGKVDIDSAPGNAVQSNSLVYEDDTDKAPGLEVRENNSVRVLSGNVWDDSNKDENGKYAFANGEKESGEDGISNVIVQLIEVKEEDEEQHFYLWEEERTGYDGDYEFTNFIPGDYIVRFIYGYDNDTKMYNGQDYKSTTDLNYENYKSNKWYNEYHTDASDTSVARDNEARRLNVMANTAQIDTDIGTALKNKNDIIDQDTGEIVWDYTDNTYMYADTSKINIAVASETGTETVNETGVDGTLNSYNNFTAVNFGLEERPKTEITLEKHITGLRITANDGTTIVDADVEEIVNGEILEFTENSIRKGLTAVGASRGERGYWRLETDIEEVIQGATLELVYTYTVRNVGEEDYISTPLAESFENVENMDEYENELNAAASDIREKITVEGHNSKLGKYLGTTYYTGDDRADDVSVVKTKVGQIEDYINNDLKFVQVSSSDFKNNGSGTYKVFKPDKDSETLEETDETINQVVISKYEVGYLAPGDIRTQNITLESNGKLTSTGTLDFPSYTAQLKSAYSNSVGRRDVYSIPGNLANIYKLSMINEEQDEYWAETVEITKPTGENKQLIITLAISITAGIAIVGGGVFAIKKYVL